MFKKYLYWSALIHLFVLWGVGVCLPPSVPGHSGPIVLEFNLGGPHSTGGTDFTDHQEGGRSVPKGKIPVQPVETAVPLQRQGSTMAESNQREDAFIESWVAAVEQRGITVQENGSKESAPDGLFEVEEANRENRKNKEAAAEEEPFVLSENASQQPEKSGPKLISGREFTEEAREGASGQNLPDTGEKSSGSYWPHLPEDQRRAATGAGCESRSAELGRGKGEPDQLPVLVQSSIPSYPLMARRRGWEGTVTLQIHLDQDGKVGEVEVLESSGYEILDQEAKQTVRGWRYTPAYQNGTPIDCLLRVKVTFVLQN
ncbi:MAG TPA: energy transducer TonB [Bacillota bacterium]